VPFESVDVLNDAEGAADLGRLGARSLPVASRGREFVFAQSLDQVASFVGVKAKSADRLPPVELVARWLDVLAIERSLVAQIPVDKLGRRPIPNRDRTLRDLAYHTYEIPDVFVRNVEGEFEDWAHYVNLPTPPQIKTSAEIIAFGDQAAADLAKWWEGVDDRKLLWMVKTHYGERPVWELLERQTWHSAQHVRQLQAVLEEFDVPLPRKAEAALYAGLPLPAGLWE
jgi:hypothetical protein